MRLSGSDTKKLHNAGIAISGDQLRVEDVGNKRVYEFPLTDIGQLTVKRLFNISRKKKSKMVLIVHKWDMSKFQISIPEEKATALKTTLRKVNNYFFSAA